ncbi:uncharacterized protein LOC134540168 [Bacillus rossius redtenbacheri]|uniref:uncharacterized protein LOC134540168 n=1 Tax=Bacillus rossius redtenbacheri TaxID=93214 RepID=UPI002FDE9A51
MADGSQSHSSRPAELQWSRQDVFECLSAVPSSLRQMRHVGSSRAEEPHWHERLKKFVNTFVKEIETYLEAKYLVLEGEEGGGRSHGVGEWVGGGTGALLGKLLGAPELGEFAGATLGHMADEAIHRRKLYRLSQLVYRTQEKDDHASVRRVLAECGLHVFRSFEMQVMGVTSAAGWQLAVKKLGEDAAHRAINFCAGERAGEIAPDLITRGVVEGRSKKRHSYSWRRGLAIRYRGTKVTTEDIYTKTGLVVLDSDGVAERYYRKKDGKCETCKFGHRVLFNWEMDSHGGISEVLGNSWHEEEKPRDEYRYELKPDNFSSALNYLSRVICPEDEHMTEERITEIFTSIQVNMVCEIPEKLLENYMKKLVGDINKNEVRKISGLDQGADEIEFGKRREAVMFDLSEPVVFFKDREEPLRKLHEFLCGQNAHKMAVVCGPGSVGKSELVRMYASRYSAHHYNTVWINAGNFDSMQRSFFRLAAELGVLKEEQVFEDPAERNIVDIVNDVYRKLLLETTLLVLDNAEKFSNDSEEDAGLDRFLPKEMSNNVCIIIISHNVDWDSSIPKIQLGHFTN